MMIMTLLDNDDGNEGIDLGEDDDDNDDDDDDDDDDIEDIDLGERSGTVNDKGNLNHHCCA